MANTLPDNGIWLDPNGLQQLRHQASTDRESALESAAEQFEAQFVTQMLKAMRATVPKDGILNGRDEELYEGLMDRQLALNIAHGQSFGLAESITRQMGAMGTESVAGNVGKLHPRVDSVAVNEGVAFRLSPADNYYAGNARLSSTDQPVRSNDSLSRVNSVGTEDLPRTPAEFVQDIMPYARQAARKLGLAPEVLVAQSALETGWGKHVIRHANGSSTHNFFNIKAHGGEWQGETVAKNTFEYSEGIPRPVRDLFRAYESPQAGFADYVNLISSRPRYATALKNADDPHAYIRTLQDSGYATDPKYASKIIELMEHPAISSMRQAFKNTADVPTNKSANNLSSADKLDQGE